MAQNLAITEKSTIFVLSLWNLLKIIISWVLSVARILAWLELNYEVFINGQVLAYFTFFFSPSMYHLCRLGVGGCSGKRTQNFKLSWHKDIRYSDTSCWDVSLGGDLAPVNFYQCHGGQGNQLWRYEKVSSTKS